MITILITAAFSALLAFLIGVALGWFEKKFKVERDPKIDEVRAALPGANCGGCGFPGCDGYAEAAATGRASTNKCTAGGASTAEAVSKIMGVSAGTLEEAVKAEKDGADYLGVGAMFPTATKKDADITTPETLRKIMDTVHIPVVTIGGMNERTIPLFKGYGLSGFAVVSAIMASREPEKAAKNLKGIIDDLVGR